MIKLVFFWFASILPYNQPEEILFIGHAYGNPSKSDKQIHPPLISFFNSYNFENTKYIVWGGDFIADCFDNKEIENFLKLVPRKILDKSYFVLGNHEYVCFKDDKFIFKSIQENEVLKFNNYNLLLANTNFKSHTDIDKLEKIILKNKKNLILFNHQIIFSKSNWIFRSNSRDNYELSNDLYDRIKDIPLTIVSGDVGAFNNMPYLSFFKINNQSLLTSGLGNNDNNFILSISVLNNDLKFYSINLKDLKKAPINPNNYLLFTIKNFIQFFFLSKKRSVAFAFCCFIILFIISYKTSF